MFVAKFQQVTSEKFNANRKGQMPFIGTVMKGVCTSSIIDGTMFKSQGLVPDQLYACENHTEMYKGKPQERINVICPVSIIEYNALDLGPAVLAYKKPETPIAQDETTPELSDSQKQEALEAQSGSEDGEF